MTQPIEKQAVAATGQQAPGPSAPPPQSAHVPLVERVIQLEQRLAKYEPLIAAVIGELGL